MAVSRRGFVGAALAGAFAACGLAACSPSTSGSGKEPASNDASDWRSRLDVMLSSALPGNTSEDVDVQETQDFDVVVVGAGCSGTNTAVRAAQAGLRVALVEKTSHLGGASLKSWAPSVPNSSFAKAAGVTTDTEPIIQSWIADSHWRVDAAAICQLVNSSSAAVDWMAELGWNFTYLGMGADITALPEYDERGPLFDAMVEEFVKPEGALFFETTAKRLVKNEDGSIGGVVVVDNQGRGMQLNARAVVIATGGYGANAAMVKAAFGFEGVFAGLPQNIGEGLEMAWHAGACKPQNFGGQMLHQTLARATDSLLSSFDDFPAKYPMILPYVANVLNVGPTGKRFRSESLVLDAVPAANSSAYQGSFHYVIVSKSMMDMLEARGLAGLGVDYSPGLPPEYKPVYDLDTPWEGITDVFERMVEDGKGYKGDTAEDLARDAGMDAEIFAAQLASYDASCEAGVDEQYGKPAAYLKKLGEGPYYAIIAEENNLCSWGGLLVNTDYQVLDDAKLPIKGLYAVGNEAGGNLYNDTYVGFGYGMANAITSGYLCGTKLGEALS